MMNPSADAVFHLPELLELILLNLSQKDLLLSQRVCSLFRYTIRDSPRIQKQLFLLPDWNHFRHSPSTSPPTAYPHLNSRPDNNRLILRAFPGCYPTVSLVIAADPSASRYSPSQKSSSNTPTRSWDVSISFPARHKPIRNPSVDYPEASWRRMYLCQPPCKRLHLVRRWQRNSSPAIVREEGITMGEFFDEATSWAGGGREGDRESGWNGSGRGGAIIRKGWHASYIASDRDWHFEGNLTV